jgi:protein CpxP
MKSFFTVAAIGLLSLGSAAAQAQTSAQAQAPGQTAPIARPYDRATPEQRQAMMAERQAKLHDALKLNATQQAAWLTYQEALTTAMAATDRAAARPAREAAQAAFAATLTPEQKAVLDAQRSRRGGQRAN